MSPAYLYSVFQMRRDLAFGRAIPVTEKTAELSRGRGGLRVTRPRRGGADTSLC
jgi:hypothetical protein